MSIFVPKGFQKSAAVLAEWSKDELPLQHQGVGDLETRMGYDVIAIQQNIEIDRPWPLVNRLVAPQARLNGLERIQKFDWLHGCFNLRMLNEQ